MRLLPVAVPLVALLIVLLPGGACSSGPGAARAGWPGPGPDAPDGSAEVFANLERLLLQARTVTIEAAITAEGAVDASLAGTWQIERGNRVRVDVSGSFLGRPVRLLLVSDGSSMRGGAEQLASLAGPTPVALNDALLLGFTRMGLMHNLAMLYQGEPPESSGGRVADWVTVGEFSGDVQNTGPNEVRLLRFGVWVEQQRSAEATLFVHPASGRPLRRRQVVSFGDDQMRVTEHYQSVQLGEPIDPAAFRLETADGGAPGG